MSDTGHEQTESTTPTENEEAEFGGTGMVETSTEETVVAPEAPARLAAPPSPAQQRQGRPGNAEHLAIRRASIPLDVNTPEVKQRLSELRTAMTTLVTDLRWGGASVEEVTERVIPLLNVGPVQQWAQPLVATILEIDRAGNLIPVWLKVIEQEDDVDLPPNVNPAETMVGRARRFAILMLGNYKSPELSEILGKLGVDANSSHYATKSLEKQATTPAMQALVTALKDAEGWAKVDIVDACTALKYSRFDELLLASGLDRALGLESYIAVPLYRTIELEPYLRDEQGNAPRLFQQATMIMSQVLQDSLSSGPNTGTLPIIFERDLASRAEALFEGVRKSPTWRGVIALHRLGLLLGRYWPDITRGSVQDSRIVQSVKACALLMPEIERWMNGPGRNVLLDAINGSDEEALAPCAKVLGQLREPRAIYALIARLDATTRVTDREQAIQLASICETLGQLGDQRAIGSMLQFIGRVVNIGSRTSRPRRRDNLLAGDSDIPGSVVYAAVIRAFGQFNDRSSVERSGARLDLDFIISATGDYDPYVRTSAFETLRRLDPLGEDVRSRVAAREALNDPRENVVRIACQLVAQYHDGEAVSTLRYLAQTRPEFTASVQDALRQLGQTVV
jgi:HEAT repeat protein